MIPRTQNGGDVSPHVRGIGHFGISTILIALFDEESEHRTAYNNFTLSHSQKLLTSQELSQATKVSSNMMASLNYYHGTSVLASIGVSAGLLFGYYYQRQHKKRRIHSSSTPSASESECPDTIHKVYLFSFPPVPHVHNISPFTLKVESFLRLWNIPYESIATFEFSRKGQVPYIRINSPDKGAVEIPDSNVIISLLRERFGIDEKEKNILALEQRVVAHIVTRMLEEHTTQIGFYYRYGLHIQEFCRVLIPSDWFSSADKGVKTWKTWLISKVWGPIMQTAFMKKKKWVSFGRHSDNEKWSFSFHDLQALSDYLGEKEYFFGEEATTIDCTMFGHLAQFLYIPMDFPQKEYMLERCQNLVRYVDRFKERYWGEDW